MSMYVSYDPDAGATYLELVDAPVDSTRSISDLVMVDVSASGEIVGVEFAVSPTAISPWMLSELAGAYPELEFLMETKDWLLLHA